MVDGHHIADSCIDSRWPRTKPHKLRKGPRTRAKGSRPDNQNSRSFGIDIPPSEAEGLFGVSHPDAVAELGGLIGRVAVTSTLSIR